nr:immunoglobulin heavy chain junction region [Mus musculus]NSM05122.1 immunoglobulin heavy chain junction region [Mus musculus]NSM06086.1 immunoglobulin heavy chain junction region [Mus musculus]NSM06570.1 immunoglobulin heavy chain junction region [Mus musculus]NSM08265.1 immunoglobulin heavy chain junction region [Mus musculus]
CARVYSNFLDYW